MFEATRKLVLDTRKWLIMTAGLLLVSTGWMAITAVPARATTGGRIPSPRVGFLAPDFTLGSMAGKEFTLLDLRGSVVVINFWASWCPPCREEMPDLREVYQEERERGLEILAVNVTYQDNLSDAEEFVAEYGLPFPILLDTRGEVANLYLMRALPTTFFVDRSGVIRKVIVGGPMSSTTLRTTVGTLLEEAG